MAQLNTKLELLALLDKINPTVGSSAYCITPVCGLTGKSWRVRSPQINWLAREQSAQKSQLGVSRQREATILKKLSYLAIAPSVVVACRRWLIVEWIEGETVTEVQLAGLVSHQALAGLIIKLHQATCTGYPLNLPERLMHYWYGIDRRRISADWLKLHRFFQQTAQPQGIKLAPAHMDIHPGNIIQTTTGLRLIDWEYAGDVDIALDIATLFRSNNWNLPQQQDFLQQYCGYPQGYRDIKRLSSQVDRWLPWVDYLILMWFEVCWQQTGQQKFIAWVAPLRRSFNL